MLTRRLMLLMRRWRERRSGILHIDSESKCVTLEGTYSILVAAFPEGAVVEMSNTAGPALVMEGCRTMHDGEVIQFAA